jgi:Tol biopolymer transport system component
VPPAPAAPSSCLSNRSNRPSDGFSDRPGGARQWRALAAALAVAAALAAPAGAQYFGRNRAAWTRFHWQVLRTAHCNVNFYQGEEEEARAVARRAERWIGRLSGAFGAAPSGRVEILLYADLADFQQTTRAPERLDPDRGPMDPHRRRLPLALTGERDRDDRQLGHELVQVFEQELQDRQPARDVAAAAIGQTVVPLWMDDGLADELSAGRDSVETAMWVRDAALRGALPDLADLGSAPRDAGERWGHAFWAYVGGTYGDAATMRLYAEIAREGVARAVRQVLRLDERQLVAEWHAAIGAAYRSFLAERSAAAGAGGAGGELLAGAIGLRRIPRGRRSPDRHLAPALSPDGSRVAYLSTRGWFGLDLDLADAATGEIVGRLLASGGERAFDALRFADSAASWAPDGKRLALTLFRGGEDRIALLDASGGSIRRAIAVPGAGALSDPAWSPDGGSIAVVGSQGGKTALWLLDLASGKARRLAAGCTAVRQPAWSPDGRTLAFACQGAEDPEDPEDAGGGRAGEAGGTGAGGDVDEVGHGGEVGEVADIGNPGHVADVGAVGNLGTLGDVGESGEVGDVERAEKAAAPWRIWLLDMPAGERPRAAMPAAAGAGANQINPQFGPGGSDLYFLSDRGGVSDVYRWDLAAAGAGGLYRVTAAATGVAGVSSRSPALTVAAHGGRLMFSVFTAGTWELHDLEADAARGTPVAAGAPPPGATRLSLLPPANGPSGAGAPSGPGFAPGTIGAAGASGAGTATPAGTEVVPYRPRLALEDISPGLGVGYNSLGYAIGADVSARLGDAVDRYQIGADAQGGVSAFPEYGGSILFLDTAAPLQWGVQLGHVPSVSGFARVAELPASGAPTPPGSPPSIAIDQIFELITQNQAGLLLQYPLSPTERIQASVSYSHLGFAAKDVREVLTGTQVVETTRFNLANPTPLTLYQGGLAFVGDTSLLGDTSPVRGQRYRAEVGATGGDLSFEQITADYRRYLLFRPLTLAVRALHLGRYGPDANSPSLLPLFLGDPTLVRGYELGSLSAAECTPPANAPNTCPQFDRLVGSRLAVVNLELRLPLFTKNDQGLFRLRLLPTELALFLDAGTAWSAHQAPTLHLAADSDARIPVASSGIAARFLLAGLAVAQVYVAKPFERPERGAVTGIVISPGW